MKFWEIGLIIVNFILLGWILFASRETKRWFIIALTVAYCVLIAQLYAEGYRWQMIPAYLSSVILTACHLLTIRKKPSEVGYRSRPI